MSNLTLQTINLENLTSNLLLNIALKLAGKYKTFQLMKDDNFVHRKDRTSNDIHLFLELEDNYFHLRSYTRHMLDHSLKVKDNYIFLTGYQKKDIELNGGKHSFRQDWYKRDADTIAKEIIYQNQRLFL